MLLDEQKGWTGACESMAPLVHDTSRFHR